MLGRTLAEITELTARAARREADLGAFAQFAGRPIVEAARRGKFLWLSFADASAALVVHLGMSGQLRHMPVGPPVAPRHTAALLLFDDGAALVFRDPRTFGHIRTGRLLPTADGQPGGAGTSRALVPEPVAHIARDPLDPYLDRAAAAARMAHTASGIKRVLLDQRYVSGIGNIYADETLWEARLHPERAASALGEKRLAAVIGGAAEVMARALESGGTSFDSQYVDVEGAAGYFTTELAAYGRTGQPCPRCGTPIRRLPFAGRSSHFCPRCQRRR